MAAELSIVIVNWNGGRLLRRCIESIAQSPPSVAYEIVVVDNASSDGSVGWLGSDDPKAALAGATLRVIANRENVGYGRANNQAIAESQASLVLLLNADTEVRPGALDTLVATLGAHPRAAACGPRLLNTDGSLQPSVWPNPPTPWEIIVAGLGLWRLVPPRARGEWLLGRHWDHARRRIVPGLFGAALLVRRPVFSRVGGFDERFHMYGEDDEWCLRVRRAGWRLLFEPSAVVVHHGGRFSERRWGSGERRRVQLESYFRFQRLCLSHPHRVANLLAGALVAALHWGWRRLRGRPAGDAGLTLAMSLAELKRGREA
jgi:GT2 family glycosyltransferase